MTLTALKAPLAESAWIDVVVASKSPEAPHICSHELVDAGVGPIGLTPSAVAVRIRHVVNAAVAPCEG